MPLPNDLISFTEAMHIVTDDRGLDYDVWIDALSVGDVPHWKVDDRIKVRRSDAETWFPIVEH
jgi:hypothetical protein